MAQKDLTNIKYYIHSKERSFLAGFMAYGMQLAGVKNIIQKDFRKGKHNNRPIPNSFIKKFKIKEQTFYGNPIWVISLTGVKAHKTILYLHGGAYFYGIQGYNWRFIEKLLHETNATIIIPDYPLTPENTVEDVYKFMDKTYEWILSQQGQIPIIIMGDSAGAGIALGFTQKLRNESKPLPNQLILLSPWLDIALASKEIKAIEKKDPVLNVNGLKMTGSAYSGDWPADDFRVSPIFGVFEGLPRISLFTSTNDILYPDCEKLRKRLNKEGSNLDYYVYPGLFHDWLIVAPMLTESIKAFEQIKYLINQ